MKKKITGMIIIAVVICFAGGCNKQAENAEFLVKEETVVVEATSEAVHENGNKEIIPNKGMDTQGKETQQIRLAEADASKIEQETDAHTERKSGKQNDTVKDETQGNTKALPDTGKREASSEKKAVEKTSVKFAEEKTTEKALEPTQEKPSEKPSETPSETPSATPSEKPKPTAEIMNQFQQEANAQEYEQGQNNFTITTSANMEVFNAINAWRVENGLAEYTWGSENEGIGAIRAYEQTELTYNQLQEMNHGYGTPFNGLENLCGGGIDVMNAWKTSPGHNAAMLREDCTKCVVYTGYYDGNRGITVALFW